MSGSTLFSPISEALNSGSFLYRWSHGYRTKCPPMHPMSGPALLLPILATGWMLLSNPQRKRGGRRGHNCRNYQKSPGPCINNLVCRYHHVLQGQEVLLEASWSLIFAGRRRRDNAIKIQLGFTSSRRRDSMWSTRMDTWWSLRSANTDVLEASSQLASSCSHGSSTVLMRTQWISSRRRWAACQDTNHILWGCVWYALRKWSPLYTNQTSGNWARIRAAWPKRGQRAEMSERSCTGMRLKSVSPAARAASETSPQTSCTVDITSLSATTRLPTHTLCGGQNICYLVLWKCT